jgi:dTDP-4-amino-4,6-dideoxygalactose transaminase
MSLAKAFVQLSYRQARKLTKIVSGRKVAFPPFGSVTLDLDDVVIARAWLKREAEWYRQAKIDEYHAAFAAWNGSAYAFSFMGGRVALSAVIYALGLQPGDEVILPGYTCVVVPNAFKYVGVKCIYSDIELDTYGLDAAQVESKITPNTKAVLLHHLYGLVCRDYDAIIQIARKHGLFVIEDCAQSTGAEYRGKKVGNWGDVAIYSSEQSKVFTTILGGMATTNDGQLAQKVQEYYEKAPFPDSERMDKLLHQVIVNYYRHRHPQRWWWGDLVSFQYRDKAIISTTQEEEQGIQPVHYGQKLPAALAAIGLNQLKKIDGYNERRRQNAKQWDSWCDKAGYRKPTVIKESVPVYLRYPVLVEEAKKAERSWSVKELGVEIGVWFIGQLHPTKQSVMGCPNAELAVKQCINFPGIV